MSRINRCENRQASPALPPKEANVPNINTIPGDDVIYIDMRVLPEIKLEKVYDAIKGMIKAAPQEILACG